MHRRLIVDMTDIWLFLAQNDRVTGIQRVVLKQAQHLLSQDGIETLLGYYDPRFGIYARFPMSAGLDDLTALRSTVRASHIRPPRPHKLRNRPLASLYHWIRTRALPALRRLLTRRRSMPELLAFRDGDIVLSLGGGWVSTEMFRLVEPLAKQGAVTPVVLIHDIIPLLDVDGPAGERDGNSYHLWLSDIARYAGGFLVTSDSAQSGFAGYLADIGATDQCVEKAPLPHEFQPRDGQTVSPDIAALGPEEYVLAVISHNLPRKNLDRLLETWGRLRDRLGEAATPRLVIAGGIMQADLPEAAVNRLGGRLQIAFRPNDTELTHLYRGALFTVFPSTYEGWGLPIGESLWMGKFCVTSNTSSMPEVGGAFCDYFDPLDIDSMAEAIERPIRDRAYLRSREEAINRAKLTSWEQSAAMLRDAVMRIAGDGE
jgi:glycosyltransferase involved in cell wall biosynthesis